MRNIGGYSTNFAIAGVGLAVGVAASDVNKHGAWQNLSTTTELTTVAAVTAAVASEVHNPLAKLGLGALAGVTALFAGDALGSLVRGS